MEKIVTAAAGCRPDHFPRGRGVQPALMFSRLMIELAFVFRLTTWLSQVVRNHQLDQLKESLELGGGIVARKTVGERLSGHYCKAPPSQSIQKVLRSATDQI